MRNPEYNKNIIMNAFTIILDAIQGTALDFMPNDINGESRAEFEVVWEFTLKACGALAELHNDWLTCTTEDGLGSKLDAEDVNDFKKLIMALLWIAGEFNKKGLEALGADITDADIPNGYKEAIDYGQTRCMYTIVSYLMHFCEKYEGLENILEAVNSELYITYVTLKPRDVLEEIQTKAEAIWHNVRPTADNPNWKFEQTPFMPMDLSTDSTPTDDDSEELEF